MEWILKSPQIHSTFGSLGYAHADGYHIDENCNAALESILHSILTEDKCLRTFRRNISFGQNINRDLIPLLIHTTDKHTIELTVKILVNLTIPIECLVSLDFVGRTDFGRHTIFELNNLLTATKLAFSDHRTTKVVIDFMRKYFKNDKKKSTPEQLENVNNCIILLRNVLHIPVELHTFGYSPAFQISNSVQNQIIWNMFSQSVDKVLIKLMSVPAAHNWGVSMVQLIALLYKDQHVSTLQKLLNLWLETSLSGSSEDNESNTSPHGRGSQDISAMLTTYRTSDSSDTNGSSLIKDEQNLEDKASLISAPACAIVSETNSVVTKLEDPEIKKESVSIKEMTESDSAEDKDKMQCQETTLPATGMPKKPVVVSVKKEVPETSDCGYSTQGENQNTVSSSSNGDYKPFKEPVYPKWLNCNLRQSSNLRADNTTPQDKRRKKLVKRAKSNIANVQGLSQQIPTDADISNVLKEFTVDFLLIGYSKLVRTLLSQILTNSDLEIDTSHFFWLVTYFLKFATQIELDFEHVSPVLSFEVVSYLTAEGVNLCEQFELEIKMNNTDLKPHLRRLHLVVTAIREFVQAVETYRKIPSAVENQDVFVELQMKMCEAKELRCLLVLLLQYYNPEYHSKQYLQDLVVTNHLLLLLLDNARKLPEYRGHPNMIFDHMKEFASPEIMYQYGLLLEDYAVNGEFVNDCVFTVMHHVGGDLGRLKFLFQPRLLRTLANILKSDFEICDDWSDLIEYVMNTFVKRPENLQTDMVSHFNGNCSKDDPFLATSKTYNEQETKLLQDTSQDCWSDKDSVQDEWTDSELRSLDWNHMKSNSSSDVVGEIIKLFKDDGIVKTEKSVIKALYKQNLIDGDEFEKLMKLYNLLENEKAQSAEREDQIQKLCQQLTKDGKKVFMDWVQNVLLDTCYVKICIAKNAKAKLETNEPKTKVSEVKTKNSDIKTNMSKPKPSDDETKIKDSKAGTNNSDLKSQDNAPKQKQKDGEPKVNDKKLMDKEICKTYDEPEMYSVAYHSIILNRSIPLVPWNCEQAATCKDLKFLQFLHKLGLHMPVDSGKVFIRIPNYWSAEFMYKMACKISPIDKCKLKFTIEEITDNILDMNSTPYMTAAEKAEEMPVEAGTKNLNAIQRPKPTRPMVNFTPMPSPLVSVDGVGAFDDATSKTNWLDLIAKSQILKRPHGLESLFIKDNSQSHVQSPANRTPPVVHSPPYVPKFPMVSLASPELMNISPEPKPLNEPFKDTNTSVFDISEDTSVSETASVASDLTRMYVSDEEDKPEIICSPKRYKKCNRSIKSNCNTYMGWGAAVKRRRLQSQYEDDLDDEE